MGLLKEAVPLCLRKHLQIPYPDVEKILARSDTLVTVWEMRIQDCSGQQHCTVHWIYFSVLASILEVDEKLRTCVSPNGMWHLISMVLAVSSPRDLMTSLVNSFSVYGLSEAGPRALYGLSLQFICTRSPDTWEVMFSCYLQISVQGDESTTSIHYVPYDW